MSANVISLDEVRFARRLQPARQNIRVGDRVRRTDSLREGIVIRFRGSGAPDDPVRAVVQFGFVSYTIPVSALELAPTSPTGAA
jgi:hypothetical protein